MGEIGDVDVSKQLSNEVVGQDFFKELPLTTPTDSPLEAQENSDHSFSQAELNRMAVFRYVELNEPTNRYQIAKGLGMAYTCVKQIMRDLVFVGIIHEKFVLLDNGTQKKVLTIPKEKKDGK